MFGEELKAWDSTVRLDSTEVGSVQTVPHLFIPSRVSPPKPAQPICPMPHFAKPLADAAHLVRQLPDRKGNLRGVSTGNEVT